MMSSPKRSLALAAALLVSLVLLAIPAVAEPAPSHSVSRHCIPNRVTVAEITLANYPEGSTFFIEDFQNPTVNGITVTQLTRPITITVDSSAGDLGDFVRTIRPKPQCRLPRWK